MIKLINPNIHHVNIGIFFNIKFHMILKTGEPITSNIGCQKNKFIAYHKGDWIEIHKVISYGICYFDMDGVIANFPKAFYNEFKIKPDEITPAELWQKLPKVINQGFYENLKPIKKGIDLMNDFAKIGIEIRILSCCGDGENHNEIMKQKLKWLEKHISPHYPKIKCCFTKSATEKGKYASPTKILIDDRPKCITAFEKQGGRAFLFNTNYYLL